jgi:hypothetical protein
MSGQVQSKRRMMRFLPPGYKPVQMQGANPNVNHMAYRDMRLAEIGRVVSMPLMMIKLDSSGHSYSSARFDGQIYARGNAATQSWLERVALTKLVRMVRREAAFKVAALRSVPEDWTISFTWPKPPHVDPLKEANAVKVLIELGLLSEIEGCAQMGLDYEQVAANIKRVAEIRKEQGISEPLSVLAAKLQQANSEPSSPAEKRMAVMVEELREWVSEAMQGVKHNAV